MKQPLRLTVSRRLSHVDLSAVNKLIEKVTDADGLRPLSEHVFLHLRHGGDSQVIHLLARDDSDELVGYAHLDITDAIEGSSAELCVDPAHRSQGVGSALVHKLQQEIPDHRLRLWAHGENSASMALATRMGFTRSRTLLQMRRSLFAPLPDPDLPAGITVRSFNVGSDETEWLATNHEAFANHPEQGSWDLSALDARMGEAWFDPAGFFVAIHEESQSMAGFHWTKVHGEFATHEHDSQGMHSHETTTSKFSPDDAHQHGHDPIGEIYVIGVRPAFAGHGLGKALALIGLRYLRSLGLPDAMLYVEADNDPARKLYESLGFTHWDTDVMFAAPSPSGTIEG